MYDCKRIFSNDFIDVFFAKRGKGILLTSNVTKFIDSLNGQRTHLKTKPILKPCYIEHERKCYFRK